MDKIETILSALVINQLSQDAYNEAKKAGQTNPNEFYMTPFQKIKTSELENDLGFVTDEYVSNAISMAISGAIGGSY